MWYGAFTQAQFKIVERMVRHGALIEKKKDRISCHGRTVRSATFESLKKQKLIQSAKPRSRTLYGLSQKGKRAYEKVLHHARSGRGYAQWLSVFRRQLGGLPGGKHLQKLFGKNFLITSPPAQGKAALVFDLSKASQKRLWKSHYSIYPCFDLWAGSDWSTAELLAAGDLLAAAADGHQGKGPGGGVIWCARCSEGRLWNQGTRLLTDWVICADAKIIPDSVKTRHSLQARFRENLRSSRDQIIRGPLARLL
ncbi:MAG: hypothetical protein R3236_03100 [Phycisphaeraceae bacterium]|nr:hypothetical protein [Phycisphaeraceae bacterium]